MSLLAMAQDTIPIPVAAGINLGANRLDFPGSRQQFDSLLIRMHDSQQRLNILHIGGSHVQAGIFPNRLREHFDASRGLLFPWKAIRTNAPRDYSLIPSGTWERSRCIEALPMERLGMSGAAATTNDSLATLRLELPAKYSFAKLCIIGKAEGTAVPYLLLDKGDTILAEQQGPDFFFTLPEPDCQCTIAFSGMDSTSRFVLRGIYPEPKQRIVYTESGVNGASVPSWLRCDLLEEELSRILRAVNPNVCFLFITNNDCWLRVGRQRRTYNRNTQKVEQAMMELARECNGAVWNQFRIMGGYSSSNRWVSAHLMNRDHIHFSPEGYELLADLLYNAICNEELRVKS